MEITVNLELLPHQERVIKKVIEVQQENLLGIYQKMFDDPSYHDRLMDEGYSQDQLLDNMPDIVMLFEKIEKSPSSWTLPLPFFYIFKYILTKWTPLLLEELPSDDGPFILFNLQLQLIENEFNVDSDVTEEGELNFTDRVTGELVNIPNF